MKAPSLPIETQGRRYYQSHKEQRKAYTKKWREENKERKTFADAEYRKRLKLDVFSHYSKGKPICLFCGEDRLNFLTLDHIKGDGEEHRHKNHLTVGTATWLWARRNNFPPVFQVLCKSCNNAKGSLTNLTEKAMTIEEWVHKEFDKSWEACNSCGLMSCQHNEIVCPFRDFKVIILRGKIQ